ncbi:MAG: S41 family peptidase [Alkaliphilus sp.]
MSKKLRVFYIILVLIAMTLFLSSCRNYKDDVINIEKSYEENTNHESMENAEQNEEANNLKPIPQHALDRIKANRVFHEVNKEEIMSRLDEFLYPFESNEGEIPVAELNFVAGVPRETITIEEAKQDVAHFFRLLKFGYAGYQYFGGDETFLKAKENIMRDLKQIDEEKIRVADLEKLLVRNLQFVQDGHFMIGIYQLMKRNDLFMSEKYEFLKDELGYHTIIEDKKYRVTTINDEDPEKYLKLSINKYGSIVYFAGRMSSEEILFIDVVVELSRDEEVRQEKLSLFRPQRLRAWTETAYVLREIKGIPIIEIRRMKAVNERDRSLKQFINDVEKIKTEEIIIIDTRGNTGGSCYFPRQWVSALAGKEVGKSGVAFSLLSNTTSKMLHEILLSSNLMSNENELEFISMFKLDAFDSDRCTKPKWDMGFEFDNTVIDNKPFLIVLMDRDTASAAESYIELLRRFRRVIFVGSNSAGIQIIGNTVSYLLPNSDVSVDFGFTLFGDPSSESTEGLGWKPDFWVRPDLALRRALKMIRKYELISN